MGDWDKVQRRTLMRMKRAHDEGRGVRISHSELEALNITFLGEVWSGIADQAPLPSAAGDEMTDRQTIETAPTDPTGELRVLTFDPTQGSKPIAVQIADGEWWRSNAKSRGAWSAPTHWMPLPKSPA